MFCLLGVGVTGSRVIFRLTVHCLTKKTALSPVT